MELKTLLTLKQLPLLMSKQEMRLAMKVLQLPVWDLEQLVEQELLDNPLVDLDESSHALPFEEMEGKVTPYTSLKDQVEERLEGEKEKSIGYNIIGSLDDRGYLAVSLEEIALLSDASLEEVAKILEKVQEFDPLGVAATTLQQALLLQLRGEESTLPYRVLETCFELLLHQKFKAIEKKLKCSPEELEKAVFQRIRHLKTDFFNVGSYDGLPIYPDIVIKEEDEHLIVEVRGDRVPPLKIRHEYLLDRTARSYALLKWKKLQWLFKVIGERDRLLKQLGQEIVEVNASYFLNPQTRLTPLSVATVAAKLELHPSTVARAIVNKWVETPKGLFALRDFFGKARKNQIKEALKRAILQENKQQPLTDAQLQNMLQKQGYECSRRVLSKYRKELDIPKASQRKGESPR